VKFRDPETGEYRSAVSSGKTSKSAAMNWADERIKSGVVVVGRKRRVLVEDFAGDFWSYEKSDYIKGKLARGGSISRGYAEICAGYVRKYILPAFGKRPLASLKTSEIEQWVLSLGSVNGLTSASVNRIYTAFRVIVREALRLGYLERDPTDRVQLLREKPEVKGILTLGEVRTLFGGAALETFWRGARDCYVANMLAAATGMRLGEIRGLLIENVHEDRLDVLHSWEEKYGLKGAKWGSERTVPIPFALYKLLSSLFGSRPDPSRGFVFSRNGGANPVYAELLPTSLYEALTAAGVGADERKSRNITFHSWRHFFNSICRGNVSDTKLRLVTGHKTVEMTERYTHAVEGDMKEIREVQARIFEVAPM
jgi:integrase